MRFVDKRTGLDITYRMRERLAEDLARELAVRRSGVRRPTLYELLNGKAEWQDKLSGA